MAYSGAADTTKTAAAQPYILHFPARTNEYTTPDRWTYSAAMKTMGTKTNVPKLSVLSTYHQAAQTTTLEMIAFTDILT